jgi:alpha-tubulin suppressor-like RCC1 family protein
VFKQIHGVKLIYLLSDMFKSNYWSNTPYRAIKIDAGKMDASFGTYPFGLTYLPGVNTCITKQNKSILIEGGDAYGQIGNGAPSSSLADIDPVKFYSIVSASLGGMHAAYIDDSARLFLWGTNANNQLGDGTTTIKYTPTEAVLSKDGNKLKINKVECGVRHTLALAEDGTLFVTGNNSNGQLGRGNTTNANAFMTIKSSSVTDIGSGWYNSYIISGGFLCAAGVNNFGQVGDGTFTQRTSFTRTTGSATNIIDLAGGAEHCLYIKNDYSLWGFGRNNNNQLFTSSFASSSLHRRLSPLSASYCSAGVIHSAFVTTDNKLYVAGANTFGQLGLGNYTAATTASLVDTNVVEVACGATHTIYTKTDGSVWFAGSNAFGQSGKTNVSYNIPKTIVQNSVVSASSDNNNTLFIKSDGTLWGMGRNTNSQLTNIVSTEVQSTPIQITSSAKFAIAAPNYSGYIDNNGNLYMVGLNSSYQLGDGTNTTRTSYILSRTSSLTFDAGGTTTFCVDTNNVLFGVGTNSSGQIGIGNTTGQTAWVQVTQSVAQVRCYGASSFLLKTNGDLYAAGANTNGSLGDGTTTARTSFVYITGSVKYISEGAGAAHMMYIKTDNTLWGVGSNAAGQLGTGNNTNYSRSIQIDTNVKHVAHGGGAANGYTIYVKNDDSVWAMGNAILGKLPTPLTGSYNPTPVKVLESGSLASVGGGVHAMIVKNDGSLIGFGNSEGGQIGDGIVTTEFVPIRIY